MSAIAASRRAPSRSFQTRARLASSSSASVGSAIEVYPPPRVARLYRLRQVGAEMRGPAFVEYRAEAGGRHQPVPILVQRLPLGLRDRRLGIRPAHDFTVLPRGHVAAGDAAGGDIVLVLRLRRIADQVADV